MSDSVLSKNAGTDQSKWSMFAGLSLPKLLASRTERHPGKAFLIWEPFKGSSQTWSYAEFSRAVEQLASGLYSRGIRSGNKVLLHMENCPEFLISWFACARLGVVAVSTNTRSVARDMAYFAEQSQAVAALTQPRFADLVNASSDNFQFVAATATDAGEAATGPLPAGVIAFDDLPIETLELPEEDPGPESDLAIQFTSGTTSRPKAVLWTHANALWGARMNALHFRLQPDDVCLAFLPLFHTNAQSYSLLGTLQVGGTLVIQPRFSASRFWDVALRNNCSWCSLIPFCVKALVKQPLPANHDFRLWVTAVRLIEAEAHFRVRTLGLWGMTETITQGIVEDIDAPGPDMNIGRVSPGYDIAVRDESGQHIQPGETGKLYIRGTTGVSLFKEYFGNTQATEKSFDSQGWFDTGDLVYQDTAGNLFFKDRDKDMLKVGAENVAASEIEAVILETGLVDECAVVGQKHAMLDEVPVAFVIPLQPASENLEAQLIEACSANLPDFKVVRAVHIVSELPRSTLEKVAKNELRASLPEIQA